MSQPPTTPPTDPDKPVRPDTFVVCVNKRPIGARPSCAEAGSQAFADVIEASIEERGLPIKVERLVCMGRCFQGPAMRLAPGGEVFLEVTAGQIPGIIDKITLACAGGGDEEP